MTLGETNREFLEAAWTKTGGDSSELDYKIDTLCAGLGVEGALGRDGWVALAGGLSLQDPEFDTAGSNIDGQVGYGPYVALEGGWQATPTLMVTTTRISTRVKPPARCLFVDHMRQRMSERLKTAMSTEITMKPTAPPIVTMISGSRMAMRLLSWVCTCW
jgi:hypothetical protein